MSELQAKIVKILRDHPDYIINWKSKEYWDRPNNKQAETMTFEEFQAVVDGAERQIKTEDLRARMKDRKKILKERDSGISLPTSHIDRMESLLKAELPQDILDDFNAQLAEKSSPISYRDIAFVACVHRISVNNNGAAVEEHVGTSPFKRIVKNSTLTYGREKPFDHRQIRYALTILEEIGFHQQVTEAVYGAKGKKNTAGKYTITNSRKWLAPFSA